MATRVIGNLNALVVGRLNDAAEAEWIAQIAGTKDSWTHHPAHQSAPAG
jgi:hypothetical protein